MTHPEKRKRGRPAKDEQTADRIKIACEKINDFVDRLVDERAIAGNLKEASIALRDISLQGYEPNKKKGYAAKADMQSTALLILNLCTDESIPPPAELTEALELTMDVTPARCPPHPNRATGKLVTTSKDTWRKALSFALNFSTIEDVPAEKMAKEASISRTTAFALKADPDFAASVKAQRYIVETNAKKSPTKLASERTEAARSAADKTNKARAQRKTARIRGLKKVIRISLR